MITKTLIVQQLPEQGQLKARTYYAVQKGEKFVLHLTDENGVVKEMQILDATQLSDLAKITQMESDINQLKARQDKYVTGVTAEKQGNNVVFTYTFSTGEPVTVTVEDKDTLPTVFDDSELKNRLNALETFKGTTEAKDLEQDGKIQALETAKGNLETELAKKATKDELTAAKQELQGNIDAKASTEALNEAKQGLETQIGEKLATSDFNSAKSALEGRIQALENASNESIGTWA